MTLRMRVLPRFPAKITGTNGLTVNRPVGSPDLIVKPDFGSLVQIPNVGDGNEVFFMAWDRLLGLYRIMSFSDLFAGVADLGFMEESVYDPQGKHADAFARANHTGTQAIATVSGLQTALDAKADAAAMTTALAAKLALAGGAMTGPIENAIFAAPGANTKRAHFDLTAVTAGQDRTIRVPNIDTSTGIWEPIGTGLFTLTALGVLDFLNLGAYRSIRINGVLAGSASGGLGLRTSINNGGAFDAGATDYTNQIDIVNNTAFVGSASNDAYIRCSHAGLDAGADYSFEIMIQNFNAAKNTMVDGGGHGTATAVIVKNGVGGHRNAGAVCNALRLFWTAGSMTGYVTVEGVRG